MITSRPTAVRRPADVVTILLMLLSLAIAALAVITLVQVEAAVAAADTALSGQSDLGGLAGGEVAYQRVLGHLASLRRFASGALFSACAVMGTALLLRRARATTEPASPPS